MFVACYGYGYRQQFSGRKYLLKAIIRKKIWRIWMSLEGIEWASIDVLGTSKKTAEALKLGVY